jgi:hypothetical protein
VYEVIGANPTAYENYLNTRLGAPTPVEIESKGIITHSGGWVTATFRAVEPVSYGTMRAHFVVIEETSLLYPWTAREVAPDATVTLSAVGDSVVVTRNFTGGAWAGGNLNVIVFLEDDSPHEVVNAQIMPPAYHPLFEAPSFASEIGYAETATYTSTLRNDGAVSDTISVALSQDVLPDGVGPSDWVASYREAGGSWGTAPTAYVLDSGEEVDLEVRLVDTVGTTAGLGVTSLTAASEGDAEATAIASFATFVEQVSILLVDDDAGSALESYLETALSDTGLTAMVHDATVRGRPTLPELSSYWAVLWTTGGSSSTQLTSSDEGNMASYLEQGGNLYLTSNNLLSSRASASTFVTDYLHVSSWSSDAGGFSMAGVAGDPISDGMALGQSGGPIPTAYTDKFTSSGGDVIFTALGTPTGMKAEEGSHKVVFTSFPFENVKVAAAYPSNQKTLISRIIAWFQGSADVDETDGTTLARLSLEQNAPNPFNPVTTLSFAVPGGASNATLRVYSVSGRVVATLHEGPLTPGPHAVVWDGTDDGGAGLASGVYFARLSADGEEVFRSMTLLK